MYLIFIETNQSCHVRDSYPCPIIHFNPYGIMNFITKRYQRFKCRCQSITESVENLIHWLPVIWKDRDFDSYFLETLIITKLNRMSKRFDPGHHEGAGHYAARMRTACTLLTRVHDEYYSSEYMNYYHQDFIIRPDGVLDWHQPIFDELGQYFDRYPKAYKYVINKYKDQPGHIMSRVGIAIRMGTYLEDKARKTAYKMIANYYSYWWD
jgi:hypothetical protein